MSNKKKTPQILKIKEPVRLRFKSLSNGSKSIYLDYYANGKREYEFLKLYLVPETTPDNKFANIEVLNLANAVKAKKIVAIQNGVHGFSANYNRSNADVITYIKKIADDKYKKYGDNGKCTTRIAYLTLARHLTAYHGAALTFKQIDKAFISGFIDYLKVTKGVKSVRVLGCNTQVAYIKLLNSVLNTAITDEIISFNPISQIKPENLPQRQKTGTVYLTKDELQALENTECLNKTIKNAFLFSCYTGLRYSDVSALAWGKLQKDSNGDTFINYVQKKTRKQEFLPIPAKAMMFLPYRGSAGDTERVFDNLPTNTYSNVILKTWSLAMGLKKCLTFHVARHTYATLLLSLGAPIESISKNLGHSDIKTTQVYADVIGKSQRAAVNLFDKLN
ncbi:MAG: site-specific integrase [Bacteroidales bacterium]|jgi:integrase|nr:site-specific integrase [Bacteroidales bacterium]